MTSNQIIESLKEVIVSLKAQLEVYRLEREQDKRQINALMSIITGLRKEISSLREAIDGRNEDLEKAKSINKGLSKIIANKAEKQQPPSRQRRKGWNWRRDGLRLPRLAATTEPNAAPTRRTQHIHR